MSFRLKSLMTGAAAGGIYLAASASDAKAAPACDDLVLSHEPNISQSILDCLNGKTPPIVAPTGPIINEIDMGGCSQQRDRAQERKNNDGKKVFETVCRYDIPADKTCPDDADKQTKAGNRFDPTKTVDGRRIGSLTCTYVYEMN